MVIEFDFVESTGRSYQNHAATIRRWAENNKTKGVPKQGIPDYTCKEGVTDRILWCFLFRLFSPITI